RRAQHSARGVAYAVFVVSSLSASYCRAGLRSHRGRQRLDSAVRRALLKDFGDTFRLIRIDPAPPSPAHAVNRGIAEARGDVIGVMIDGARIITPELLHFALHGAGLYERAVVFALGWYLGYDMQRWSMRSGYDQVAEDALLAQIDWPKDGYRLFEIGTPDESSVEGWFRPVAEANALF